MATTLAALAVPAGVHSTESPLAVCVPMLNSDNMQYTVPIKLGTPGQSMQAIPDTGSFELVIPSTECGDGCKGHPLFNSSLSASFEWRGTTQTIHYGQGDVGTEVDYDTVRLGGMEVQQQSLLKMKFNGLENYDLASYDAVMGLGLSEQARPGDTDLSLLASMSEKVFGICLGQADGEAGRLDLGGGLPGAEWMAELPCTKTTGHWGLTLASAKLGDVSLGGKMSAIVDSGTSLFAMPTETYEQALDAIGEVDEDCSNLPDLPHLTLAVDDEHTFVIPPELYVGRVAVDDLEALEALMHGDRYTALRQKYLVGEFSDRAAAAAKESAKENKLMLFDPRFSFRKPKGLSRLLAQRKAAKSAAASNLLSIGADAASDGSTICLPLLMELNVYSDEGPLFILGMPFLRAYAARFNLGKQTIGFAQLPLEESACVACTDVTDNDAPDTPSADPAPSAAKAVAAKAAFADKASELHSKVDHAKVEIHSLMPAAPHELGLPPVHSGHSGLGSPHGEKLHYQRGARRQPVKVALKRALLPWWAVRLSTPREAAPVNSTLARRGAWRHLQL